MHPSPFETPPLVRDGGLVSSHPAQAHSISPDVRASANIRRLQSEESWIEVASRPSSSSLSSTPLDEPVRVDQRLLPPQGAAPGARVRRRPRQSNMDVAATGADISRSPSAHGSSQEEYEESDSEPDRVITSSNEDLLTHPTHPSAQTRTLNILPSSRHSQVDDDESATALGVTGSSAVFTPQPNVFSHPPAVRAFSSNDAVPGSYFARMGQTPATHSASSERPHYRSRARSHATHGPLLGAHAPSLAADHDAALRASLSTLLSCAAAARGLPKRDVPDPRERTSLGTVGLAGESSTRVDASTLRLVPESTLNAQATTSGVDAIPPRGSARTEADARATPQRTMSKRKSKSPPRERRKKHRTAHWADETNKGTALVQPTLTTWMLGAGVLVLFSAISFSAGYALGKEVGHAEGLGGSRGSSAESLANSASDLARQKGVGCGRELMGRGRSWRWGHSSTLMA